jgi:hypothetical protein
MEGRRIPASRVAALVILGVILAGLAVGVATYVIELPVETYATFVEAETAGAIERGWVPAVLPRSATGIRAVQNLDTNARWLAFRAPPEDLRSMVHAFGPLSHAEARRTAVGRPWRVGGDWPPELSEPIVATPRNADGLGYYRHDTEAYCWAIEWPTGRAWGWSC